MRFALGQIEIEEYRRQRDAADSMPRAAEAPPARERHGHARWISLVVVVLVVAVGVAGFVLVPRSSPSLSVLLSTPREIPQADLDSLLTAANTQTFAGNNTIWVGSGEARLVFLAAPPEHDEIFVING
jgi:hypothetical protein